MTLQNQLKSLRVDERQTLMYALNQLQPYYVILEDGTYIGVHLAGEPNLVESFRQGPWSQGTIKMREALV